MILLILMVSLGYIRFYTGGFKSDGIKCNNEMYTQAEAKKTE